MSDYREKIIGILRPKIGSEVARSALYIQCKKCGIAPEDISSDDLVQIAENLYNPLRVFAGDDFAKAMVAEIKKL